MSDGEVGIIRCQLRTNGNCLIELPSHDQHASHNTGDDWRERIELMRPVDFGQRVLLPASQHAEVVGIPLMCGGIAGVEFESFFELSFATSKVPVILHLVLTQNSVGM